jgi:hypothetical protein
LKTWDVIGKDTVIPVGGEYVIEFVIKSPPSKYLPPNTEWRAETFFLWMANARSYDGVEGPTWIQVTIEGGGTAGLAGTSLTSAPQILYLHKTGPSTVLLEIGGFLFTEVNYTLRIRNIGLSGGGGAEAIFGSIEYLVVLCAYSLQNHQCLYQM